MTDTQPFDRVPEQSLPFPYRVSTDLHGWLIWRTAALPDDEFASLMRQFWAEVIQPRRNETEGDFIARVCAHRRGYRQRLERVRREEADAAESMLVVKRLAAGT